MDKIKCWSCGKDAFETRIVKYDGFAFMPEPVSPFVRCYCKECRERIDKEEKEERELYIHLKKREMFKKACTILEGQATPMYEYKEAIDRIEGYIDEYPDMFDSSYEVLTAIVLVHNNIRARMQYKVAQYQVDFLLPDLKIVLEIDGERHKQRKTYDKARDIRIKRELGEGWQVIRIPTDRLDENAKKIPEALYKVSEYRQTGKINWRELQQ